MGQAPTSHLRMKGCCSSLPLTQRQFWSIRLSLWTAVFSAVSCLSRSLVDTSAALLLTSHPPGEWSQSVPFNHPARRKLSDHPRGVLVWSSAVMAVRSAELSPWEDSVCKGRCPQDRLTEIALNF